MTTGEGLLGMDVAVFMACMGAAAVNIFYAAKWYGIDHGMGVMRLLRVAGWLILSTRFGFVLSTTGDILISVPSAIAMFFLAAGEVAAVFNRGKVGKL
jgi:hypothetical protein